MKGSITQRTKDTWRIQVYTGKGPDGNYRRHTETVRGRKGDAQRRLNELLTNLDKGVYIPPVKLTVTDLLNQWLEGYAKTNCSARTLESYQSTAELHLIPAMGHIPLKQLQPQTIQCYYGKASQKLSSKSVLYHHRILKHALKYAVRQGYLARNPCDLVSPPRPQKKAMRTLIPSEVTALLEAASDNRFYPVIYTAVSTGLRQAELLALRWRDIDFDSKTVLVSRALYKRRGVCQFTEPKTAHSRRRVSMPDKLVAYLSEYKAERESLSLHLGCLLHLDDLVFADVEGQPLDPGVLSHNFARIAKRAGLLGVRFHDLRHTFASLMLLRGAKPKVISEALGHASVAFTLDTYSHIIEGMQSDAMVLLDGVLPEGKNELSRKINTNLTPTSGIMLS
jgi:integrase